MFEFSGKTQVYGIFGAPVAHSLSPLMQNAAIRAASIDAVYVPFHVDPQDLGAAIEGMRSLNISGVNITLPHKQQVLSHLDRIDDDAALIGAVNTIVRRSDEFIGYNTDGLGFIRSLQDDLDFSPTEKSVLLLGAGGACRAAAVALLRAGVSTLFVANRNKDRAEQLIERISPAFPKQKISALGLDEKNYLDALGSVDLVVNTTSVGLQGEDLSFCELSKIKASAYIYDMVYSRAETPFVCAAKKRGLIAADGLGMLAGQGEEAFSLWFDVQPKAGLMKNCLMSMRKINT